MDQEITMRLARAAAPLLFAALVAACSGTAATSAPTTAPATAPASAAAAAASSGTSGGAYGGGGDKYGSAASPAAATGGIAVAKTTLGSVLTGPTGMTLYAFMPDTSTTSACTGNCAAAWPPLTGDLPTIGAGLDASKFGSLSRADGTKQITFNGHPLYFFGGDKAAGDTNGQGLSGKWYVLGSDGNPIK
jgi:predicted lipoprotein with Yx(FWY)xxD motif